MTEVVTKLTIDASGMAQGFAAWQSTMNRIVGIQSSALDKQAAFNSAMAAGGVVMVQSSDRIKRLEQQWLKLAAAVDPTIAAYQKFGQETSRAVSLADVAIQRLKVSETAANAVMREAIRLARERFQAAGAPTGQILPGSFSQQNLGANQYGRTVATTAIPSSIRGGAIDQFVAGQFGGKGAEDSAKFFKEMADGAARVRAQIDPLAIALGKLGTELAANKALLEANAISAREFADAQALIRQRIQDAGAPIGAASDRISGLMDVALAAKQSGASAAESARFFKEMADGAARIRAQIDPLTATLDKFNAELAANQALLDGGAIKAREFAAAQALIRQRIQDAGAPSGPASDRITGLMELASRRGSTNKSAEESAKAFQEMGDGAEKLRMQIKPLETQLARINAELAENKALAASGAITNEEWGRAQAMAAAKTRVAHQALGGLSQGARLTNFEMANLSFQINDIGVMMASGQSPFILIMQQGMQIAQIFAVSSVATQGLKGALLALGDGVVSFLVSPLNRAVIVLALVAGGIALLWNKWSPGAGKMKEDLTALDGLMKRWKESLGDAGKLIGDMKPASDERILEFQARLNLDLVEKSLPDLAKDISQELNAAIRIAEGSMGAPPDPKFPNDPNKYLGMKPAFDSFRTLIKEMNAESGKIDPNFVRIQNLLLDIGLAARNASPEVHSLLSQLFSTLGVGVNLQRQIEAYDRALKDRHRQGNFNRGGVIGRQDPTFNEQLRQMQSEAKLAMDSIQSSIPRNQRTPEEEADLARRAERIRLIHSTMDWTLKEHSIENAGLLALAEGYQRLKDLEESRTLNRNRAIRDAQLELDLVGKTTRERVFLTTLGEARSDLFENSGKKGPTAAQLTAADAFAHKMADIAYETEKAADEQARADEAWAKSINIFQDLAHIWDVARRSLEGLRGVLPTVTGGIAAIGGALNDVVQQQQMFELNMRSVGVKDLEGLADIAAEMARLQALGGGATVPEADAAAIRARQLAMKNGENDITEAIEQRRLARQNETADLQAQLSVIGRNTRESTYLMTRFQMFRDAWAPFVAGTGPAPTAEELTQIDAAARAIADLTVAIEKAKAEQERANAVWEKSIDILVDLGHIFELAKRGIEGLRGILPTVAGGIMAIGDALNDIVQKQKAFELDMSAIGVKNLYARAEIEAERARQAAISGGRPWDAGGDAEHARQLTIAQGEFEIKEALDQRIRSMQQSIAQQQQQLDLIGTTAGEAARLRTQYELTVQAEEEARRTGGLVSPGERAAIEAAADAAGRLAENIAFATSMDQLLFDRTLMSMSKIDQTVAQALRSAGLSATSQAGKDLGEQIRFNEELKETRDVLADMEGFASNVFGGLINDLRQGTSFLDAMTNALNKIGDKLLNMALDNMFTGLFGSGEQTVQQSRGGIFGFIGSILHPGKAPPIGTGGFERGSTPFTPVFVSVVGALGGGGLGGLFDGLGNGAPGSGSVGGVGRGLLKWLGIGGDGGGGAGGSGAAQGSFRGAQEIGMALAGGGGGTPSFGGNFANVKSQVWNFFASKGLAPHQIAGIMGNVQAESGFNPTIKGDSGQAYGLFQWNDRKNRLFDFIGGKQNLGDVQKQLDFAWHELQTSESDVLGRLRNSTDVRGSTTSFMGFERMRGWTLGNPEGGHNFSGRIDAAEEAFATHAEQFGQNFGNTTSNLNTTMTNTVGQFGGQFQGALQNLLSAFKQQGGGGGFGIGMGPLGGLFGGLSAGTSSFISWLGSTGAGGLWADGGIMRGPSLNIMGEGSYPEAAVPLPNGRSIPVEWRGGGSPANSNEPIIIKPTIVNNSSKVNVRQEDSGDHRNPTWVIDDMSAANMGRANSRTAKTTASRFGLSNRVNSG